MKDVISQIGNNLKEIRKNFGLTQAELAQKINVDPKYISRIETGVSTPSITTMIRISKVLNVDVFNFFLTESEEIRKTLTDSILLRLKKANQKELKAIFEIVSLVVDK